MRRYGLIIVLALALVSCDGTSFRNSVPPYPVRLTIDVERLFVDFVPENFGAYITVDRNGYYENGRYVTPALATDMFGYGGVLIYISTNGYDAYDRACPNCASHSQNCPCLIENENAVCPKCGEAYSLWDGTAMPQKGLSHETLRVLNIRQDGRKLHISQKQ